MGNNNQNISLSPLKITVIYLIVAGLWIAFTDQFLESLVSNTHALSILQTYKGWFYVTVTALGLFWLLKLHERQLLSSENELIKLVEELKTEKELNDILFERIPVLITIYDPDLEAFEVNKEFEKVTGWTNEEITEQNIDLLKAVYPDLETRKEAVNFMSNTGIGWKEFKMTTRSGEDLPTSWTNIRLTDNTSVGIGIDMSEIKASQAKIRESQKLLKKTFESLESSLIILDYESRTIIDCNKSTEELFGYSKEELEGSSTRKLHVSETKFEEFGKLSEEVLLEKGVFQTEFVMQRKDGSTFYSGHTVTLVYDEDGEVDKVVSVVRDISDRKKNELELKRRQERLLRSQKIGQIGDWELDIETEEITWSPTMYKIFERDPELGVPSYEEVQTNYHGSSLRKHNEAIEKAVEEKKSSDIDLELKTNKGNNKFVRAIVIPKENEEGEVIKLLGIVQDITERKQVEKELAKEKQRFQLVAQTTSDVIWDFDLTDNNLWWSKGFEDHFGYDISRLADDLSSWTDHIHPEDKDRATESLEKAINGEDKFWQEQYRFKLSDGSSAHIIDQGIIIRNENGEAVRMVGTLNNITERVEAEQRLRESEKKYRHIFKDNPEPMWIYNPDTLEFVEVNQAAIKHYGYSEKEFLNMTLADIRPPENIEKLKNAIDKHRSEKSYFGEWRHLKKNGSLIHVEVTAANVQYKDKTYRLALMHDITEQKHMQQKIIESVIEGENRERKRIAHELHDGLGQYLVAANMNLESIKKDIRQLPEKREQQFQTGLSLLKNALSETRSIAYNLMPKTIAEYGLVMAVKNLIQNLQKSSDIIFHFDYNKEELNLKDQAEINIYRIIQELLSNAVRHADCSTISTKLQVNHNSVKLIIEDDGKGAQLEEKHGNKGLGLRSIKTRVSNLQGTLDIKSQPGEGMTATINIPHLETLRK